MIDFIIVGRGLAATSLMHSFDQNNISFHVIGDSTLSNCSKAAAGIWNPVVFKRLTKSWLADELVPCLNLFYTRCEQTLRKKLITQRPIIKPFTEEQEKTLWLKKAKTDLENFLEDEIYTETPNELEHFKLINGYSKVKNSGNLNVAAFLNFSSEYFKDRITNEIFEHSELRMFADKISYKNTEARNIIFCEGYLVKNNPLFHWIPLNPAKGEVLTIKAPKLSLSNSVFNRNGFLMDLEDGSFKAGATYEWKDLNETITDEASKELEEKIGQMIQCEYSIIKQEAGVRPSSSDRRPIIGGHPSHKNAFVFNGLGTKGVMLAPFFCKNFVNFYLQKEPIHKEADISRFYHLYDKNKQD